VNGDGGLEAPGLRRDRAERLAAAVLPGAGVAWGAAEIMHLCAFPHTLDLAGAAALATVAAWGAAGRGMASPSLPVWTGIAGAWVTAAEAVGPLAWHPAFPLTAAWAVFAVTASRAARRHEAVVSAREWREARAEWLGRSHDWGLGGSHLLDYEQTRIGELYTVSIKGTRKLASAFIGNRKHEEYIAQQEDLAPGRVAITRHTLGLAGRIRISVRRVNPWAEPLLHPLVCDEPEVDLPEPRSIRQPVLVGQDPETGTVLSLPLWDKVGAKNVSITGMAGAGKGVLLDDVSEWVTAAADAMQVRVNLSDKGHAEIESWGPSCHLTAFGPEQAARAADVLKVIAGVIGWRARAYKRGQYQPTPADPLIVVIVDESDAAAAVRALLDTIATKGREYGVALVRAGQRNTPDYGSAKQRSQDTVRCVGAVNRTGEANHAAGNMAAAIPDMASYGEGQPGVWSIAVNGGSVRNGRTWVFSDDPAEHGAEVETIAQERAFSQPELPAACREFLGEPYEELLKTEVFAKWARANGYADEEPATETAGEMNDDGEAPAAQQPPTPASGGGTEAPAPTASRTVLAEEDPLRRWEMDMGEREREMLAGLAAKLGGARRMITETMARPAPPEVSAEVLAAHVAERWWKVGEAAEIPEQARPRLVEMLAEGTTISKVAAEFKTTKWTARQWLQRLRNERVAYVDGTRSTAKWRLAPPPDSGDAPSPLKD
jgi:hypothetical protein